MTPERSPASSAASTPRKSAMAERIAQEKARLKKLEHELSEKLKLYGQQQEEAKRQQPVPQGKHAQYTKNDTSDAERSDRDENQLLQHSERTSNSSSFVSEKQELVSREQHNQVTTRSQKEDLPLKDKEVPVLGQITPEQLERIRKLQVSTCMGAVV